jgi:hypothetical protein
MDFSLPPDVEALRTKIAAFVRERIRPLVFACAMSKGIGGAWNRRSAIQ